MPYADFRQANEDFQVKEELGFELSGHGEHSCLCIEKNGQNTHWVAQQLASYANVSERDIGMCGRKDRHAVTQQWFSIYDPQAKCNDWSGFACEGVRIVEHKRHQQKLRLGMHCANAFVIRLRQVRDQAQLLDTQQKMVFLEQVHAICSTGVPNYFGSQRFGREANNLLLADAWFTQQIPPPRKQKSMVLSAARAYLFNQVLAQRVRDNNWSMAIAGDCTQDHLPTGPLWGRGRLVTKDSAQVLEQLVLERFATWCERLEHQGLSQERRALVLYPKHVECCWEGDDFVLHFSLPSGAFATAVLAEIACLITSS